MKKKELKKQLKEADRRAGEAERKLSYLEEDARKLRRWADERKEEMGLHHNASFDKAWAMAKEAWDREQAAKPEHAEHVD